MIDQLPVIASGVDINQLLGLAKITSSTGDGQATAVFDCLKDGKLVDRTVAVCFFRYNGTCVLLEMKLVNFNVNRNHTRG